MTLKEKFAKAIGNGTYYVIPIAEDAEIIEKIADDFTIEFYNWMRINDTKEVYFHYTDKDMLNAFKEEQGL